MRRLILILFVVLSSAAVHAGSGNLHVDGSGVLRFSDSGEEASFYGVNYTVPFAHAYRALGYLGVDRKEAIDRDTYHFARLGLNAFRIHIWDVEISDSVGNVIDNEHLDLLDYLIYKVEQRGMSVVLTAQTDFGNGYPERNIDTGGFSYRFGKCDIHDNPEAIAIQERYLKALAKHKNKYTGETYSSDDAIIALEINNEPCHSGTSAEARKYIQRMVNALKKGGFKKPILYNVSHNFHCTEGFFDSPVQGTTYQWYPMGLVAGHERKGNYLPNVDSYDIPFSNVANYGKKARFVYEFDPADNLYSYLYPATVRSFRKAGFQWITQFAYDPIDMAWANTEYQTHFLNLAYTPNKAISMKIAAEAAHRLERGCDFGTLPNDTVFAGFRVSYRQNLSEYDGDGKFLYSNTTHTTPSDVAKITEIAGCGSSSVVSYSGTGAYFLDKLDDAVWRLEVMPDVVLTSDPFQTPSLKRSVGSIIYRENLMNIELPGLGETFSYKGVNKGNDRSGNAKKGGFRVYPGVYLLASDGAFGNWTASSKFDNIAVGEYVAPAPKAIPTMVCHTPQKSVLTGDTLIIRAKAVAENGIDSLVVYPDNVSFWSDTNTLYKMNRIGNYEYEVKCKIVDGREHVRYNIVAFSNGKATTFPQNEATTPLDWDYKKGDSYVVDVVNPQKPIVLLRAQSDFDGLEVYPIPGEEKVGLNYVQNTPVSLDCYEISTTPTTDTVELVLRKYVADLLTPLSSALKNRKLHLSVAGIKNIGEIEVGFVTDMGAAYSCRKSVDGASEIVVSEQELMPSATYLCPAPFPTFLKRKIDVKVEGAFEWSDAESLQIVLRGIPAGRQGEISINGIWFE